MAYKQNQDHCGSYMDGVKVKISERYKPPPKITLPMPYSQRIELNKQIRDSIPSYDFVLEKTVKEKMREWREARSEIAAERKIRLDKLKEVREERIKKKLEEESTDRTSKSDFSSNYNNLTEPSVLIPTRAEVAILTPTPLGNLEFNSYSRKPADKSPFNISDFDTDTSSPFDNVALKSINDMAELALVLKNEEKTVATTSNHSYGYDNRPITVYSQTYGTNYDYFYQPSTSANSYNFSTNSNDTYSTASTVNNLSNGLLNYYGNNYCYTQETNSTVQREAKVPDIVRALQTELDNNRRRENMNSTPIPTGQSRSPNKSAVPLNHRKTEIGNGRKVESKTDSDECYRSLPVGLQKTATEVSGMGFPLERVSRVCKLIGDDRKKIVEHLLALSDLLDLGFSELDVSKALMQCDNDRDKALDRLIT